MGADLKSSIVIVNEFSVPLPDGGGSRGGTPGQYIERYMARDGAVESLAPIRYLRTDDYIVRYMAREEAVEAAAAMPLNNASPQAIKTRMRAAQGKGGLAFGYGSVSLSDEQLRAASRDIQTKFEAGHTVMKTVLSFDEEYLRSRGIVSPDFTAAEPGDYRGHIDQMKLRMAVMQGLKRMSHGYDDLRYVGVIQVDTLHVHAHLAMVDAGKGNRAADGRQRGKILDKAKSRLRRGIDSWLDQKQVVAHLSSAVGYERRNVTTYIKRWAHEKIRTESLPQFITACLPRDRSKWRAGTNDKVMRKANKLVAELVTEQLDRPDSPMPAAMAKIQSYADQRKRVEKLDAKGWHRLVDQGRAQIMERAVNGVYQMLRTLPQEELQIRTPMLEVMSMDYEQMAVLAADRAERDHEQGDELVSFGFRLRGYGTRLVHHTEQAAVYRDLSHQWEKADDALVASADTRPLYDFYRHEELYHRRLMVKYQHFLPFMADKAQWQQAQEEVSAYGQRLLSVTALRGDASLQRMKDGNLAESLGRDIYGQPGGRLLTEGAAGREVLDGRIAAMKQVYDEKLDALRADLAGSGLVLKVVPPVEQSDDAHTPVQRRGRMVKTELPAAAGIEITEGSEYSFEEVKSLDLHHLGYDFLRDMEVGRKASARFIAEAAERRALLMGAMEYLDRSGQAAAITDLPVDDVASMSKLARQLTTSLEHAGEAKTVILPSKMPELRAEQAADNTDMRRSRATSLGADLVVRVREQVDEAAEQLAVESYTQDQREGIG